MPSTNGRRSRAPDSDDESQESRAGTPISTAPNDSKRARRIHESLDTPGAGVITPSPNMLTSISKPRKDNKPVVVNGTAVSKHKYQPGAIRRVKLTNFVTYTLAEFHPGPNLNMVIGPNGTGKSTLVCAICLGLGWGTQHLGRAKDVSEFVKHGCREATIEIELQRDTGLLRTKHNPVITRTIKREGNKSTYTVNGMAVPQKIVQDLARSLSIQIDNLCQFLPQDKVVEFAAMTPIELLRSTQQAAAPPLMLQRHEDLAKLRVHQKEILMKNSSDREQLVNLENRQEMNRVDVERMREKEDTQQKVAWLKSCRPIAEYGEAKAASIKAKELQKALSLALKKLTAQVEPTLKRVNAKQTYTRELSEMKEQLEKDVKACETSCDKIGTKMSGLDDKVKDCDTRLEAEKKSRQPKKDQMLRAQQAISNLKGQIAQPPSETDFEATTQKIKQLTERRRQIEAQGVDRKTEFEGLKAQKATRNSDIQRLERRLNGLETQTGQQEAKLEKASRDTFKAWQWIQENPNFFDKQVYGPPMIECSLKDPKMANYVESFLQETDFTFITVQSQADFDKLRRQLAEMKLHGVSIRTCSVNTLDGYQPPMSTEQLRSLGLEYWTLDQLQGPTTVIAMLCMQKGLHQSAISTKEISHEHYERISNSGLKNFAAGKTVYQVTRRAEYGAAGVSSKTRQMRDANVWTHQPVDTGAKAAIQREIGQYKIDLEEIGNQMERLKAENAEDRNKVEAIAEKTDELRKDKDEKQRILTAFKALPTKLEHEEEKLRTVQKNIAGARERLLAIMKERDQHMIAKAEASIEFANAITQLRAKCEKLLEVQVWDVEAQNDFEILSAKNRDTVNTLERKRAEDAAAREEYKTALQKAKEVVNEVHRLNIEGKRLMREKGDDRFSLLMEDMGRKQTTVNELEAEIDTEKARLELIQGVSGNVVKDFETRAERIAEIKRRMEGFKEELTNLRQSIQEVRGLWEPQLDELVGRISEKFGESFARIGCAGQVVVFKASSTDVDENDPEATADGQDGNGLDFANWAIHISVKFRENEALSLLDAHRQSGGERAVSTIFYLMALQSLSRAPFRVVDEINQGMDPRNERMVHGRMVDIATPADGEESGGSQYFLITPKLLSGLKYRRGMTVLCIVSGENVPAAVTTGRDGDDDGTGENQKQWKMEFSKIIRRARKMNLNSRDRWGGGRRLDSGIGLENSFRRSAAGEDVGGVTEVGA